MDKVYQINMYEDDGCDGYDCTTLGIFTDKLVAEGIVLRLLQELEEKLCKLYEEEKLYEGSKKYVYDNGVFICMNSDFLAIEGEIRELQKTSYEIQEIIVNQLIN